MVWTVALYTLFAALVILSCIYRNSRPLSIAIILFMWITYGWSSGNADFGVYCDAYYGVDNGSLNIGFRFLYAVFSGMGASYRVFLIVFSLVFLALLYWAVDRMTDNAAFVLGMYLFFPFALDVVQIKNFAVVVFLTLATSFLVGKKNEKRERLRDKILPVSLFALCVLLATFLHYSAIIYFILLVPYFFGKKTTGIVAGVLFVGLLVLKNTNLLTTLGSLILPDAWVSSRMHQGTDVGAGAIFERLTRVIFIAVVAIYTYAVAFFCRKVAAGAAQGSGECELPDDPKTDLSGAKLAFIDFIGKANVLLLICFPLMFYSQELYRIQQNFLIVNLAAVSFILEKQTNAQKRHKILLFTVTFLVSLFLLHKLILGGNTLTVFRPFFENNVLFGG